jgi:aspartyl-tRNA(Asn)/glutamyl-tRNA(Gln) amidotransferase subunit C
MDSMNIQDLQETAALAHLNLREDELQAAFPAFEEMLAFFTAMQAADKDEKAFPASVAEGRNASSRLADSAAFRADSASAVNAGGGEALLQKAGERDGSFIVIPNVL